MAVCGSFCFAWFRCILLIRFHSFIRLLGSLASEIVEACRCMIVLTIEPRVEQMLFSFPRVNAYQAEYIYTLFYRSDSLTD